MNYPLYIIFGLAPSLIWLLFFLRKDKHPESKSMVLKIFFYGMLAAVPAAILEIGIFEILKPLRLSLVLSQTIYIFFGVAFIEEISKYVVVRKEALKHRELDEPIDVVLYMIIAALGFAAMENLLILLPLSNPFKFLETFLVSSFRFVGATFLHALASGTLGYFLALSFFEPKKKSRLIALGLSTAVVLHGLYNLSIIRIEGELRFLVPVLILAGLAIFASVGFKKIIKLKSICKLK